MRPSMARSSMECFGMAQDFCFTINVLHVFIYYHVNIGERSAQTLR